MQTKLYFKSPNLGAKIVKGVQIIQDSLFECKTGCTGANNPLIHHLGAKNNTSSFFFHVEFVK